MAMGFWRSNRSGLHWPIGPLALPGYPVRFLLPGIALFGTIIAASAVQSVWIGLHDRDGIGAKTWVGSDDYRE
ncbi:hypothetical protein [Verminephrobacter eiseniae]|uniref:hypothetical protein n=1 Tax=Verminephrobacter eiseniae TaxID=364317 RepID=UPI0022382B81|nr:hypothetical protein [Verminephrobacter eiseniae]MCW5231316.1 hypothetical protein [Verminephrobacter eiseniae]MCW5293048.1 hypothetical protein [Verminephrobacter eiseniae]MCW8184441.1 hypothetical protein [Verminephrobacter eiseniae]MCW8221435.1 hypothetical protein [Verminephrobacter eiseniae]MCW8232394.1 hypothetical protein [Verminephrobacter eiseniae]